MRVHPLSHRSWCPWLGAAALAASLATQALAAPTFSVSPLVTDDPAVNPAALTDPSLKNAWGVSFGPTGPFWVSANGTGVSTLYSVNPATQAVSKLGLTVSVPGNGSVTGQVFNPSPATSFQGDLFVFVSEDGTVSGWRTSLGTQAETLVPASPDNAYKGAALGSVAGHSYLYAANFKAGRVDVVRGDGAAPALPGAFSDPGLPAGFAPFNVQTLGSTVFVSYAQQDAARHDEIAGPGLGYVDAYSLDGHFLRRVAQQGALNAPWGMALAPSSFGSLAGMLLVGNFGDGRINAYDPVAGTFLGALQGADGHPVAVEGLWAITPGNDGSAGSAQRLYFTAGPQDEAHGLVGVLTPIPEPGVAWLLLSGVGVMGGWVGRRRPRRGMGTVAGVGPRC